MWQQFRQLAPEADPFPEVLPAEFLTLIYSLKLKDLNSAIAQTPCHPQIIACVGFFRVGELILSKATLRLGKVCLTLHYVIKKTQLGAPETIGIKSSNDTVCPVSSLVQYLRVRPKVAGPLFCHFDGSPVTRYQFTSVLKKALRDAGLDYTRFSSHSFRIGAATTAALKGISAEQIQRAGRWCSQAVRRYIRHNLVNVPDLL
ncbi:uncharacterized protein LOC128223621 [Mya arenaria]|uniref:uncharacterized protein LOC128223621 n=1 Tax=Mya arenaria TaxID=6604 RepID=UPI0022E21188|nr:uncharacterized protein LOC128223621 [Mya arenaria]